MSKHPTIKLVGGQKVPAVERYKEALQDIENLKIAVQSMQIAMMALREDHDRRANANWQAAQAALYVANLHG